MSNVQEKLKDANYACRIAFRVVERGPDRVIGKMPLDGESLNPFGTVHAGAMVWFADVCATYLALGDTELGPQGQGFPLAVDLHTVLLGNVRSGELTAESRFVRKGKRISVVRTQVTGPDGKVLIELTSTHVVAT
jgi:uncharacterized protein (TIGR00369 family)